MKVGVLFFGEPATHLWCKQIVRHSMNHLLDHGLSETIEYLTNFFRKCLMGKYVDVSEQLEEKFANLASFQTFFFSSFFVTGRLCFCWGPTSKMRYGQEEIRRAEMRSKKVKWKSWRVFLRETKMQVPCLTNIVKGLVLLMMIFSSKMFELFLWPSCVRLGFVFFGTSIAGCEFYEVVSIDLWLTFEVDYICRK